MTADLEVIAHQDLNEVVLSHIRELFDREYLSEFGVWNPDYPYGYSPEDLHVIARSGSDVIGHVGFQKRVISVGMMDVLVAGTGGVLVSDEARGAGLGQKLLPRAQESIRNDAAVSFGYLGCRPAVVPFYLSAGWTRIKATERHTARFDPSQTVKSASSPILICPAAEAVGEWLAGDIDLRGGAW